MILKDAVSCIHPHKLINLQIERRGEELSSLGHNSENLFTDFDAVHMTCQVLSLCFDLKNLVNVGIS